MRSNYKAQADKICHFFGYETVYEYNTTTIHAHISFDGERPEGFESFVTTINPWFED